MDLNSQIRLWKATYELMRRADPKSFKEHELLLQTCATEAQIKASNIVGNVDENCLKEAYLINFNDTQMYHLGMSALLCNFSNMCTPEDIEHIMPHRLPCDDKYSVSVLIVSSIGLCKCIDNSCINIKEVEDRLSHVMKTPHKSLIDAQACLKALKYDAKTQTFASRMYCKDLCKLIAKSTVMFCVQCVLWYLLTN